MHRHLLRGLAILTLLAVTAIAVSCSSDNDTEATTTTEAGAAASYNVTVLRCFDLDDELHPARTPSSISTDELDAAGCEPDADWDAIPDDAVDLLVVPTGRDRNSVEITSNAGTEIAATVNVPAPDCMVTADWRGQLTIALMPVDDTATAIPDVELTTNDEPC